MKSRRILTLAIAAALILSSFATSAAASGVIHRDEWRQTHLSGIEKAKLEMEAKAEAEANENEAPESDAEGNEIATPEGSEKFVPLSIAEPLPEKNVLAGSDFNDVSVLGEWNANTQTVSWEADENGGYIKCSGIVRNYQGFNYTPANRPDAGKYKVSGYVRCATPGEITTLRMFFFWGNGEQHLIYLNPTSSEWLRFETYIELTSRLTRIHICGDTSTIYTQPYCFDNIAIEPVDSIPAEVPTVFGTFFSGEEVIAASLAAAPKYDKYDKAAEDAAGYEIQGIMINQDADGIIAGLVGLSDKDIIDFAKSFKDTHVTDYVMCLNNTLASFPSESWYDVIDKYYEKEENGVAVDYTSNYAGSYHIFEALESDYFGRMIEGFREVGINSWISMRMNDVHAHSAGIKQSSLLSDFHYQHPEVYRVKHPSTQREYWNHGYDYTYRIIQERMLSLFNDALNRYDVYGIELDFLRDMYLWYIGGEYNGLDIFNGLMRELRDLVAVYEEKYGHEIKIGVRVLPYIESNYTYGLDVMTWVSEDIVDMVCLSGEFNTTDNNPPIRLWKSLLAPYDVELAGCIEQQVSSAPTSGKAINDFEAYNAAAASYLSQGADKIYLYNYFLSPDNSIAAEDRITTDDNTLSVNSLKQYHNIITTIGSYDKLMTKTRKLITTYPTTYMAWENTQAQLPQSVFPGRSIVVQQYVGDIPENAKVTLKFSLPNEAYKNNPPDLLVNGVACTYEKIVYSPMGIVSRPLFCYNVPTEACTTGNFYIEILPKDYTEVNYVEVYIEPAK